VILADGYGTIPSEILPTLIIRRDGRQTVYRAVIEPVRGESVLRKVEALGDGGDGAGVRIRRADGGVRYFAVAYREGKCRLGEAVLDGGHGAAAFGPDGSLQWMQLAGTKRFGVGEFGISSDRAVALGLRADGRGYRLTNLGEAATLWLRLPGLASSARILGASGEEMASRQADKGLEVHLDRGASLVVSPE